VVTSLAGRLARMEHRISAEDDRKIRQASGGYGLKDLAHRIVQALDPDQIDVAWAEHREAREPVPAAHELKALRTQLIQDAVRPLHDPKLRELLVELKKKNELVIDHVSADEVLESGFSQDALDRAKGMVQSFEQFIAEHKDEITALQVLYSKPYKHRLTFEAVKELADAIEKPPYLWNESQLWNAYAALEQSRVKGASGRRILTDLVSLVRFAIHQDNELIPFPERVNANFKAWLASQTVGAVSAAKRPFTEEQLHWLEMIRDHIAANLGIEPDDFEYAPFAQEGGLGKVHQLFGDDLVPIIADLNTALVA
jgi:type I restriction enzyme R subunit